MAHPFSVSAKVRKLGVPFSDAIAFQPAVVPVVGVGVIKPFLTPAAEVAASFCLRRAAALAGLGLELWG